MFRTARSLASLAALPFALLALAGCADSGGDPAPSPVTTTASSNAAGPTTDSSPGSESPSEGGSVEAVRLGDEDLSALDWTVDCLYSVTASATKPDGNRVAIDISASSSPGQADQASVDVYGPGNAPVETWVIDDLRAADGAAFTERAFDRDGTVSVAGTAAGGSWGSLGVSYDETRPIEVRVTCPAG